jgi:hypothetical protein
MKDSVTLSGSAFQRLVITSSFVAKASDVTVAPNSGMKSVNIATFRLAPGGWIIQAKATVIAKGSPETPPDAPFDEVRATLVLEAAPSPGISTDQAEVTTAYTASIVVVIGVQPRDTTLVELYVQGGGEYARRPHLSNIVITGIRQDDLISVEV